MKKIKDFEIVDHGVEHPDYFQGCGVTYTKFDDCATGIGRSLHEALGDALEQLAADYDLSTCSTLVDECAEASKDTAALFDDAEVYYYASIRAAHE